MANASLDLFGPRRLYAFIRLTVKAFKEPARKLCPVRLGQ